MLKKISLVTLLFSLFALYSCTSIRESYKAEELVSFKPGLIFMKNDSIATLEVKYDKNKKQYMELKSPLIPGIIIKGQIVEQENDKVFLISDARLFGNWNNGWSEGFYEATGKYILTSSVDGTGYYLKEVDPFELWDIKYGEIRYFDNYYRNDDGLWKVKNRVDRLKELTRVLKQDFVLEPIYGNIEKKSSLSSAFKKDIFKLVFPELNDFKKLEERGELPKSYYESPFEIEYLSACNILWRTDYTKSVFPDQLWSLRDSGTLFRDAQEAPELFFSLYNLDGFFDEILKQKIFIKR